MELHTFVEAHIPHNQGLSVETLPLFPEIVQAYARYLVRHELSGGRATLSLDVFLLIYNR